MCASRLHIVIDKSWNYLCGLYAHVSICLQDVFTRLPVEIIAITCYLVALFVLRKNLLPLPARETIRPIETAGIIRKPSIDLSRKFDVAPFYVQPRSLLAVAVFTLLLIEALNVCFILWLGLPGDHLSQLANRIAVSASAVSILFPVALLIIETDWGDGLVNVTKSQTLLSYSLALPLGLSLLSGLARYSFELHPLAGALLGVWSVAVAAWVFYRLVRIVLYPSIRKHIEERVVKDQVFRSIKRSAEERAGFSITQKYFETNKSPGMDFSPYTFLDKSYRLWIEVKSNRAGIVNQIDYERLRSVYQRALTAITPKNTSNTSGPIEKSSESQKLSVKINLRTNVGKEIEIGDPVADFLVTEEAEQIQSVGTKAFIADTLASIQTISSDDQGLIINQFEEFSSHLKLLALKAVKDDDVTQLPTLERYLGAWLEALNEAFGSLEIQYNVKTASGEQSSFLFDSRADWRPLTEIVTILDEVGIRALKKDSSDRPEFAKGIIDLAESLFRRMARHGELLSSSRLLWTIYRIAMSSVQNDHRGSSWLVENIIRSLESFSKYFVAPKLEDIEGDKSERRTVVEFMNLILEVSQEFLRLSLTSKRVDLYTKVFRFIEWHPAIYRHEDLERDLQRHELYSKVASSPEASSQKATLLKEKIKLVELVETNRLEVVIGQGVLVLMALAGEARDLKGTPLDPEIARSIFQLLAPRLPTKLNNALALVITTHKTDPEKKWGWNRWEYVPSIDEDGSAKWMQFNSLMESFLDIVLIKAAIHDTKPEMVADEYLDRDHRFRFQKDDKGQRPRIEKSLQTAIELKLIAADDLPALKARLNKYLDAFLEKLEAVWKLALVQTPLDEQVISSIPKDFDDAFSENVRVRSLVSCKRLDVSDSENLPKSQWGSHRLYQRELFIREPGVHHVSRFGLEYGSGFARSEDEFIFHEILKKAPQDKELTIPQAVEEAIKMKLELSAMFVLTSRDPELMKSLRKNKYYEPIYRADKITWEHLASRPDGFLLYNDIRVPIYHLILRENETKQGIVVGTQASVAFEQLIDRSPNAQDVLPKSGFSFEIEDPLTDAEFRRKLVAEERDWLKDFPKDKQETYAPMYIGLSFLQRVEVKIPNQQKIVVGRLAKEDQDLE